MALLASVPLIATQSWPQGDARDPLGIWGMRELLTGTGDGGSVKVIVQTPVGQDASYVYSALGANVAITNVPQIVSTFAKVRILTNWPNVDLAGGVQAFATARMGTMGASANFTEPVAMIGQQGNQLIQTNDRFLLMYDPRPAAGQLDIMELEVSDNVLATVYAFEAYGYFWDRAVMDAPGGPRHP